MIISHIVAVSKNGVIGNDNKLLWKLSADMKKFKELTTGHHILMGRKTFDSIGKPLPNRSNIVITRNKDFSVLGCLHFSFLENAMDFADDNGEKELFIIGGAQIYRETENAISKIYLTLVNCNVDGDATYQLPDFNLWNIIQKIDFSKDDKNEFDFTFFELERK